LIGEVGGVIGLTTQKTQNIMSSIKYIIGQYTRVNSFIRSRGCAALDRINEFTREYCPITYTYFLRDLETGEILRIYQQIHILSF